MKFPCLARWLDLGVALALATGLALAAPPPKSWTLAGPPGSTPRRVTDKRPLSDQQNRAGWVKVPALSDEFNGSGKLDTNKWIVGLEWWAGRQPAWFNPTNVTVQNGCLNLTMRRETLSPALAQQGYQGYTSAALHSRVRAGYGYYEVRARPMNSAGSSSFWFQQDDSPAWQTEIDVFEIGGKAKGFERKLNMNVHVFRTPQETRHWDVHGEWLAPAPLADDFHVYGLEWDRDQIRYYFDGVLVRWVENTMWHQPLFLIFDSETMSDWFGMPADADLPSTFSVDYVRAWVRRGTRE
jgi:beta-glucanase (GH16 family)